MIELGTISHGTLRAEDLIPAFSDALLRIVRDEKADGWHYQHVLETAQAFADDKEARDMRQRWDALWSLPHSFLTSWFDQVYQYANDDHVDTVLRRYFNIGD